MLAECGADLLASFATEESPNTFPALPVREGEHVFIWFASFPDAATYERHLSFLAASPEWSNRIAGELAAFLTREPEILRLPYLTLAI